MKEITQIEQTMTLKEITDMLEVRHNDAMKVVYKMSTNTDFGEIRKFRSSYTNNIGAVLPLETYQLNKRQSIAVSAKLNTTLLMRIIDRWQELEQTTQTIADTIGVDKEAMIKDLKLDASIEVTKANIEVAKAKGEHKCVKILFTCTTALLV